MPSLCRSRATPAKVSATFTPKDEFAITNQTSTGKETIFLYRYAGGSEQELELAPKEKLRIKQSDSGSPVFFDEKIVGIALRVNKENDRVTVLRAPAIDERLGQILRGRGVAERNILFTGVLYRKRPVEDWSVHARTELASPGLRTILVADPTGRSCALSASVVAIAARNEANPQYVQTEANYKSMCGRDRGGFAKYLCDSQRQSLQSMPRTVSVWTIEVDVSAKAPQGAGTSQLGSYRFSADPKEPRDAVQRSLIGKAVAATAKELVGSGACD